MGKPNISYKDCMACGICISVCPFSCLTLTKNNIDKYKKAYPNLSLVEKCTECGICEKACPIEAIRLLP